MGLLIWGYHYPPTTLLDIVAKLTHYKFTCNQKTKVRVELPRRNPLSLRVGICHRDDTAHLPAAHLSALHVFCLSLMLKQCNFTSLALLPSELPKEFKPVSTNVGHSNGPTGKYHVTISAMNLTSGKSRGSLVRNDSLGARFCAASSGDVFS